ncbi:MAG: hypothetical protein O3A49_05870 [Candidatus Marinimicrobia bacterium]|nr:hypothetical protein [Candidatus Neomarinimicrobiota bacterium]
MDPFYIFSGNKKNSNKRSIKKSSSFNNPVIFINGFNGSGKTLISPIVASLPKVELMTFMYPIEWASSMLYSNNMSPEGYREFIKMVVDESIYNQQMSRSVNFRPSDLSSVFRSTKKLDYFKRLFNAGDDHVVPIIKNNKPISCFTTCHLLPLFPSIANAFKSRLLFLETVRDPLLMYEQLSILGNNILDTHSEKDFTFRAVDQDISRTYLDFYSNKEVFLDEENLTHEENLINYIERFFDFYFNTDFAENLFDSRLIFIPFEEFVTNPNKWIDIVSSHLNVKINKETIKEMARQKVPRKLLSQGLKLPIYKKYGAKSIAASSLAEERNRLIQKTRNDFEDPNQFSRLISISEKYIDWKQSFLQKI